jgi:thiamine biosynthesis lipoprotein
VLNPYEAVEPHMGTLFRIKLYAPGPEEAKAAFHAAFVRIEQLDRILSDYRADSELSRLSTTSVGQPVKISADLFRVLAASQDLAEETGGAFDVTLGPVIRLWRDARKTHVLPAPGALSEAASRCGYRKLHLDEASQTAMLDQADMQLDVGGIAKGYAADEAVTVLSRLGIHSALVAASGDLAFSHAPPGQRGWKIGLDSLDQPDAPFAGVVELSDAAVSTSGDTEQHLDIGGKRYSHIIDPATHMGLTTARTVTVIAARGITADGMATALSVLGSERGLALIEKHPDTSAVVVELVNGKMKLTESSRFRKLKVHL